MKLFHGNDIPDLFPYRIKKRDNFYDRDHPKNLHPSSNIYKKYWESQIKRSIEGSWINDEGTWVFMYPKLHFYINIGLIRDEDKKSKAWKTISPRLRDVEWIVFTYFFCCQGFSGFEDDPDYTCNLTVKKIEDGDEIYDFEIRELNEHVRKPNGEYKNYVDPWVYLTQTYLIDRPLGRPLGRARYDNIVYNAVVLGARGFGKSKSIAVGDLMHEFLTGAVKFWEDRDEMTSNTLLFFVGSPDKPRLQKLLNDAKNFYDKMPGTYGKGRDKKPSPFYRKLRGSFTVEGADLKHEYQGRYGDSKGSKSVIEKGIFTTERPHAGVGDRYTRMYCDEFGLAHNALAIHAANKSSLMVGGEKSGMAIYTGTSGDIERVQQPKKIFQSPDAYEVFSIPNYWENPDKRIGLFVPAYYGYERFKDEQGNTKLKEALDFIMKERKKILDSATEASDLDSEIMDRPIKPSEMFLSTKANILPSALAKKRLEELQLRDLFKAKAHIGWFEKDESKPRGVDFKIDVNKKLRPILDFHYDKKKIDERGAVIIYEFPPDDIPKRLYKTIYDPVKDLDGGQTKNSSLASVIVYKGFHLLDSEPDSMQDTIVAEWLGRYDELTDMHDVAINMAKFFNSKILPETNITGFTTYCKMKKVHSMLEKYPALAVADSINEAPNSKNKVGFNMKHQNLKWACEQLLKQWLLQKRGEPDEDGNLKTTFDYLYSPRILDEIGNYDREANTDHVSSLFGLMLWLSQEKKEPIKEGGRKARQESINEYYRTVVRKQRKKNPYYAY